jgi:hypothetical protein
MIKSKISGKRQHANFAVPCSFGEGPNLLLLFELQQLGASILKKKKRYTNTGL